MQSSNEFQVHTQCNGCLHYNCLVSVEVNVLNSLFDVYVFLRMYAQADEAERRHRKAVSTSETCDPISYGPLISAPDASPCHLYTHSVFVCQHFDWVLLFFSLPPPPTSSGSGNEKTKQVPLTKLLKALLLMLLPVREEGGLQRLQATFAFSPLPVL